MKYSTITKELLRNFYTVVLGLVLAIGLSYAHASVWVPMPANPPQDNAETPINISANDQIKEGGLTVNTFLANLNAQFDQQLYLRGTVRGVPSKWFPERVIVQGMDGNSATVASVAITDDLVVKNDIRSSTLANVEMKKVCADTTGVLILCDGDVPPPNRDVCPNIDGDQPVVPAGMHIDPTTLFCVDDEIIITPGGGGSGGPECPYVLKAEFRGFRWAGFYVDKYNMALQVYQPFNGAIDHLTADIQLKNDSSSPNYAGPSIAPVYDWSSPEPIYIEGNRINSNIPKEIPGTSGHTNLKFSGSSIVHLNGGTQTFPITQACTQGY